MEEPKNEHDDKQKHLDRRQFIKISIEKIAVCTAGIGLYSLFDKKDALAATHDGDCEYTTGLGWKIKDDEVVVTKALEDFPAHKAGIRAGDIILHWGDDSAKCLNSSGGKVVVLRNGERLTFNVTPVRVARQQPNCSSCMGSMGYCGQCVGSTGSTGGCCISCTSCTGCMAAICSCTGCTRCTGCTYCTSCTSCMACKGYRG